MLEWMTDVRKSSHTRYDLKYHLVWVTKYRFPVLRDTRLATRLRDLIRLIASQNEVHILAGTIAKDHVHLFVSAPPNLAPSKLVQYFKGVTSRKLQQEFSDLRKRYWGQHLWARGFFVVSAGNVTQDVIQQYILAHHDEDTDTFKIIR